jgi:subtilisin family serine protease
MFSIYAFLATLSVFAVSARAQGLPAKASEKIPNQYVVTFNDGVDAEAAAAELGSSHRLAVMQVFKKAVKGFSALIPPGRLAAVRADSRVKGVGADRTVHKSAQTIPLGIDRIDAAPGSAGNDGSGVHVAVIDTGIDSDHPDLAANFAGGVTLVTGQAQTTTGGEDDEGHGTHVAGTIAAADNTADVVGVGANISLWGVKVLDSNGSGSFSDIIAGLDWVVDDSLHPPIKVVNMSLGAYCSVCTEDSTDPTLQALRAAIQNTVAQGVTVVVAAGNDGGNSQYAVPAAYDEVITVSAHTDTDGLPGGAGPSLKIPGLGKLNDDSLAKFSNYGADVDITAPGVSVLSTKMGGGTVKYSGTSMAAPHVAGAAALVLAANAGFTPAEVKQALVQTGECSDGSVAEASGCSSTWPGDPDGIPDPLLNAARASTFGPPQPEVLATLGSDRATYVVGEDAQAVLTITVRNENGEAVSGLDASAFQSTLDGSAVSLAYAETATPGTYAATLSLAGLALGNHAVATTATDGRGLFDTASASFNIVEPGPTLHVGAIDMSTSRKGKNTKAQASVTVLDGANGAVAGALVQGDWTHNGAFLGAGEATTDASGVAAFESRSVRASSGDTFTFTVTGVVKTGSAYDAGLNAETGDSITVQ